jgi:hypothetical protein
MEASWSWSKLRGGTPSMVVALDLQGLRSGRRGAVEMQQGQQLETNINTRSPDQDDLYNPNLAAE